MAAKREISVPARPCWHCGRQTSDTSFCGHCRRLQPFPERTDYFTALDLPLRMVIDPKELESRFYALSRRFHPDLHQMKEEIEREASLGNTALINQAYRTLRDPIARAEYLVQWKGEDAAKGDQKPPADLFDEILELQETLEQYRSAPQDGLRKQLEGVRSEFHQRNQQLLESLERCFSKWDALSDEDAQGRTQLIQEMADLLSHRAYLGRVLGDIDQALRRTD